MVETAHPVGIFSSTDHKVHFIALSCLENPSAIKRGSMYFYDFRVFSRVCMVGVSLLETEKVLDHTTLCCFFMFIPLLINPVCSNCRQTF